jgi:hypothetical protein
MENGSAVNTLKGKKTVQRKVAGKGKTVLRECGLCKKLQSESPPKVEGTSVGRFRGQSRRKGKWFSEELR